MNFIDFTAITETVLNISPHHYLIVAVVIFTIGLAGALTRRNAIIMLMSVELMLNSVNLVLLASGRTFGLSAQQASVFVIFVITVAAAEAIVGLALILALYRKTENVNLDDMDSLKW
jgi:NADH-quinone oxidoreductase subunit K